jgi:hypothetical protein
MSREDQQYRTPGVNAVATRFPDIQRILDEAVEGQDIGAHRAFWRDITRDEFVAKTVFGCRIIFSENGVFNGPRSPLVQILQSPIECPVDRERPQMPVGFPPVPADRVQTISDWIDAQCPA